MQEASASATLRTVLLAAGVSAAVSLSVIALVLYQNGAPRPAMLPQASLALLSGAGEAGRSTDLGSIPPAATPVPEEAKPDAAAPKDVEAPKAPEGHQTVAAAPTHGPPMEAATPLETGPAETGSTEGAEPPPEQAAPKEAVSEDTSISTPQGGSAASSTDGQALAALDATQFLRRGLNMLASGNVSAAQLLLQRSAELGNGEAAYALATTYDGAPGAPRSGSAVRPNSDLAWRWYERAQELGVADARKRLDELKKASSSSG